MNLKTWRIGLWLCLIALLTACATPQKSNEVIADSDFIRTGRFAINLTSTLQDPYAAQGGFKWHDTGERLRLDLNNPMGSILARIDITANQSVLQYSDGTQETAVSPAELLKKVWGYSVPVTGLRYWIQGKPLPNEKLIAAKYDGNKNLISFEQTGWQVKLLNYDDLGPRRINLLRTNAQDRLALKFTVN